VWRSQWVLICWVATQGYFWHVVDGDRILARSETMVAKVSALEGAQKVKSYAGTSLIVFEYFMARNGKYDWHAKATRNHEIMIESTYFYDTAAAARNAGAFVENNASTAVIVDMTRTGSRR
jgi:uncharacterized protein YegP (UPF0339 family)